MWGYLLIGVMAFVFYVLFSDAMELLMRGEDECEE